MAVGGGECHATLAVGADGQMDAAAMERFAAAAGLPGRGLSYTVVSILGPQGSGKSTLLNHLFGTDFREMDALKGRNQTTKGIWIAKAVGIEPFTVVLDLEGTDGRERGQDDTTFEKQSALFALAVSDIVMINLWCHDIGRDHAANRPLLKTVFQVLTRLFSPRKTTLLLVIRDKTKTPLEYLRQALKEDIQKIWDSVQKPEVYKEAALSEFFNVEVTALSSYEEKEELFKEQVGQLRQRFYHSIAPGGLAADRRGVVPASGFCLSALQIWKVIRENKDLNLPAHKVMVATVRCEEAANEKLKHFMSDKGWLELEAAVKSGPVPSFGTKLSAILDFYLSEYDMETMYFDEGVRTAKRQHLESSMLNHTYPALETLIEHLHLVVLNKFKSDLEQSLRSRYGFAASVRQCAQALMAEFDAELRDATVNHVEWDASNARNKLEHHIQAHVASIRNTKLAELKANYEKKLSDALARPIQSILETGERDSWESIRRLYRRETENAALAFSASLSEFELDQTTSNKMVSDLKEHARSVVEMKAREAAGNVLMHMKERFSTVLNRDADSMPRTWTADEDIRAITREARLAALRLLSVMAAIRLDDKPDKIDRALITALLEGGPLSQKRTVEFTYDPFALSTWEEVSPKDTLITPVQCKSIWRQFNAETEYAVAQAISMKEAHRRSKNWLPPAWTILLLAMLGFNEFMFLLRNPLYLLGLFVASILCYAVWLQYDISAYFRHGTLSALLTILSRLLSTIMDIVTAIVNMSHSQKHSRHPSRRSPPLHTQSFRNQTQGQAQVQYMSLGSPSSSSSSVDSNSGDES
ncbi:protein ROOT HAIR DEFECTIVE 3 homolog 2-like isoform X2 [Phragmites australis]|uniref:protein ROOT HAIR DEFECTIVE 3 homolog 2-like isoform X2 n=1 Tax=Phragmites australis TaxID=29695 RepID=UPI002D77988C|nr:protein ROOT HAIR DEFECTIVE 3 homolog 2-like isoform X2 [Phragmites australis]